MNTDSSFFHFKFPKVDVRVIILLVILTVLYCISSNAQCDSHNELSKYNLYVPQHDSSNYGFCEIKASEKEITINTFGKDIIFCKDSCNSEQCTYIEQSNVGSYEVLEILEVNYTDSCTIKSVLLLCPIKGVIEFHKINVPKTEE